jgi:hypothetical protein
MTSKTAELTAESNLASALEPTAKALGENQATSCLVDLEGMLTASASGLPSVS